MRITKFCLLLMIVHATETWKILPVFETKLSLLPIHANTYLMYTILYFVRKFRALISQIWNMALNLSMKLERGFVTQTVKQLYFLHFLWVGCLFIYRSQKNLIWVLKDLDKSDDLVTVNSPKSMACIFCDVRKHHQTLNCFCDNFLECKVTKKPSIVCES